MVRTLNTYKFQILALLGLAGGLLASRGGATVLMPLVRVMIPLLIAYLLFKLVRKKLSGKLSELMKKQMEAMQQQGLGGGGFSPNAAAGGRGKQPASGGPVIDLCPQCGAYKNAGHRCKKK